jgi:hypothetical protein
MQLMSLVRKEAKPHGFQKGKSGNPAGKKPGTKNKVSIVAARRVLEAAVRDARGKAVDRAAKDLTPLGFMEAVLRTPSEYPFAARSWAAKEAAPYLHRKMPIAIEGGDKPIRVVSVDALAKLSTDELERLQAVLTGLGVAAALDAHKDED